MTILCGACSNLHFELRRGTPGFGTQVLGVGKSKNSEIHHTHQVTMTVFAELCPNDPVTVKRTQALTSVFGLELLIEDLNMALTNPCIPYYMAQIIWGLLN